MAPAAWVCSVPSRLEVCDTADQRSALLSYDAGAGRFLVPGVGRGASVAAW
jgi:hypothetical protein